MNKGQLFVLSLLSGLLLYGSWPVSPFCFLIFFAFIPLLVVADKTRKRLSFFGYSFISLLIFNAATTWWIWNSTDIGSVAAIVANSVLMCLPWWGYHMMLKKYGRATGSIALISFWMLFEYIHLNWQLSWPWLSLGNVFAANTQLIQWYQFTGVGGGTLWVLMVNVCLKQLIGKWITDKKAATPFAVALVLLLIIPLATSFFLLSSKKESNAVQGNILLVQANINPYEKFQFNTATNEIGQLIALSESKIDSNTQLIIWPETALSVPTWQDQIDSAPYYKPVFAFLQRHPTVTLLSGIETYKKYGNYPATKTCRKGDDGIYYDAFNAAVFLQANKPIQLYNKSKLVPGVESMPTFLNFLAPIFEKFGGTTGGYGRDDSSKVFKNNSTIYQPAPVICYESIYGEYVASYVKRGANMIAIMTNDGWWGNTPGHKQHLQYARLRAIETKRWIARSANTGISAVIDNYGNIITSEPWDKVAVIKYSVPIEQELSFYVRYGDYLYKIAVFIAILLLLWHLFLTGKQYVSKNK